MKFHQCPCCGWPWIDTRMRSSPTLASDTAKYLTRPPGNKNMLCVSRLFNAKCRGYKDHAYNVRISLCSKGLERSTKYHLFSRSTLRASLIFFIVPPGSNTAMYVSRLFSVKCRGFICFTDGVYLCFRCVTNCATKWNAQDKVILRGQCPGCVNMK